VKIAEQNTLTTWISPLFATYILC